MRIKSKIVATALAAALATTAIATPSHAYIWCAPKTPPAVHSGGGAPVWALGCIFASAFGLITAALAKKEGELTIQQAQLIAFTCGVGTFAVLASLRQRG
ncbi:MAG TPA: hypothetical protein VFY21_01050 [Xanthobacteraceae bacterium]|nr:hypothetical protein [Xanthobacteraceae bacterium]